MSRREWSTEKASRTRLPLPSRPGALAALPPAARAFLLRAPPAAEVHFKGCDDLTEREERETT